MTAEVFEDNSPPDAFTDREVRQLIGETATMFYKGFQDARMTSLHSRLSAWEGLPDAEQASRPRPTLNAARDLPVWVECLNLAKTHVLMILCLSADPDQPAIPASPGLPSS